MTTTTTSAKGELMGIIWLNAADNTFMLIHKINVMTFTLRFVQFTKVSDELLERLRETHADHTSYVTSHLTYKLHAHVNDYVYVPIPEEFAVYNNIHQHQTLEHVVSSTEVNISHKYPVIPSTDAHHYELNWKPNVLNSNRKLCPDSFTCMYQSKPVHTLSNVITDQWKQVDINNTENWSITYY